MNQLDIFGDKAPITKAVKRVSAPTKKRVVDTTHTKYIGLNEVYKNFGDYIKNTRSNKTI